MYLLFCGSSSTSNNFDQFIGNGGLSSSVEENLVLVDHISSVGGCVLSA